VEGGRWEVEGRGAFLLSRPIGERSVNRGYTLIRKGDFQQRFQVGIGDVTPRISDVHDEGHGAVVRDGGTVRRYMCKGIANYLQAQR
jgi:hypothetical protein